jgi:hypothetical protein
MFNFYQNGVMNAKPGNLTESGSHQRPCLLKFSNANASLNVAASFFPLNTVTSVTYSQISTGFVQPGFVQVGATLDSRQVVAQLSSFLTGLTVKLETNGTFTFTAVEPGIGGNATLNINGSVFSLNTVAPANIPAGRFLVPETNNFSYAQRRIDQTPGYRLPVLGDSAGALEDMVLLMLDHSSNISRSIINPDGRQTPGSVRAGMDRGAVLVEPSGIVAGSNALFVETINAGINLAGKITATPTATTLSIPQGKIFVKSGIQVVGQLAEIRMKY